MHRFYVARNLATNFAIGYEEEPDNFYIIGQTLGNAPLISCRIYGPSGEFLFGLDSNKLTPDSPSRFRVSAVGTRPGWSIQDDTGKDVLSIETLEGEEAKQIVHSLEVASHIEDDIVQRALEQLDGDVDKVTRIYGVMFDKNEKLAAWGDENGLSVNCPCLLA